MSEEIQFLLQMITHLTTSSAMAVMNISGSQVSLTSSTNKYIEISRHVKQVLTDGQPDGRSENITLPSIIVGEGMISD